ncbi:hypothetical protein [Hyalangium minutum]|uniref:Uncharacterized protein n=1 Tax=Hyalangium minutum TaxID=394096 RepID=A0A085WSS4_9BACT|nr:hypothetical protein [Hyalangium minutum]KFE70737.1 hypothetical protein DB31_5779 [Hyalangium minutum]
MITLLVQLDQLLRGESTRLELLRRGSIDISPGAIALMSLPLSFFSGICMGVFSLTGSGSLAPMQIIASALKMPALFFLTLVVTFPSLYVFNALVGSRLALYSVLKLLVAAIGIMLTVLASLGPIVAFFAVTTTSYAFMKLLNVAVFTIAGVMGGGFLLRTLHRLNLASDDTPPPASPGAPRALPVEPGANVRNLFRIWVVVFALVGAQMAWILRPFIGDPEQPFQWFRPVTSNFFEAVWRAFQSLF